MVSAQSACRLPSSYLPLVSQDITAGRPSAGQGQPSCAVERLTSTMSVCVWPRSGSERGGRPGFSEIWTQRSPPSWGKGQGDQGLGIGSGSSSSSTGESGVRRRRWSGTGRGESRLRKASGRDQVLSAVRDGSLGGGTNGQGQGVQA